MGRFETGNMWMKTTPYRIRCRYCGCESWPSRDLTSEIRELFPADGRTDGQADMMKLILSFRNFANAPKNITSVSRITTNRRTSFLNVVYWALLSFCSSGAHPASCSVGTRVVFRR